MKILIINPASEIVPPRSGGMMRSYYMATELSKLADVTLVCSEHADAESSKYWPSSLRVVEVPQYRRPGSLWGRVKDAAYSRLYAGELASPTSGFLLSWAPVMRTLAREQAYDLVMINFILSVPLVACLRRYFSAVPIYIDSYNVDSLLLKRQIDAGNEDLRTEYEAVRKVEGDLHNRVDLLMACSSFDAAKFGEISNGRLKTLVVPNGCNPSLGKGTRVQPRSTGKILFCGTLNYEPNVAGLRWFLKEVWPDFQRGHPQVRLVVVGRGASRELLAELSTVPGADIVGEVADTKPYYEAATFVVAPLLTGSGTRLKILESMGHGVPVLSTSIGAEGIDCADREHVLLADTPEDFGKGMAILLADRQLWERISGQALDLVHRQYSWAGVAQAFMRDIRPNF